MDYQPPELCIVSIKEADEVDKFVLDMQSIWRPHQEPAYTVDGETIDYIVEQVVMCPPNWPNPPQS